MKRGSSTIVIVRLPGLIALAAFAAACVAGGWALGVLWLTWMEG